MLFQDDGTWTVGHCYIALVLLLEDMKQSTASARWQLVSRSTLTLSPLSMLVFIKENDNRSYSQDGRNTSVSLHLMTNQQLCFSLCLYPPSLCLSFSPSVVIYSCKVPSWLCVGVQALKRLLTKVMIQLHPPGPIREQHNMTRVVMRPSLPLLCFTAEAVALLR